MKKPSKFQIEVALAIIKEALEEEYISISELDKALEDSWEYGDSKQSLCFNIQGELNELEQEEKDNLNSWPTLGDTINKTKE